MDDLQFEVTLNVAVETRDDDAHGRRERERRDGEEQTQIRHLQRAYILATSRHAFELVHMHTYLSSFGFFTLPYRCRHKLCAQGERDDGLVRGQGAKVHPDSRSLRLEPERHAFYDAVQGQCGQDEDGPDGRVVCRVGLRFGRGAESHLAGQRAAHEHVHQTREEEAGAHQRLGQRKNRLAHLSHFYS